MNLIRRIRRFAGHAQGTPRYYSFHAASPASPRKQEAHEKQHHPRIS